MIIICTKNELILTPHLRMYTLIFNQVYSEIDRFLIGELVRRLVRELRTGYLSFIKVGCLSQD